MRVCIIELDYHTECLNSLCKIFSHSVHDVSIYTKASIMRELSKENYLDRFNWFVWESGSKKKFIEKNILKINKNNLIFFATIARDFRAYSTQDFQPITLLRLHNVNTYFNRWNSFSLGRTPFFWFKTTSHVIRNTLFRLDWKHANDLIKRIDYFTFPDSTIANYVVQKGYIEPGRIAPSIPLAVFDDQYLKITPTEDIYLTIPGGIDPRRKEYGPLLKTLEIMNNRIPKKIILTFLGKSIGRFGEKIIRQFSKLQSEHLEVKYYLKRVPQNEFNEVMRKTDFIYSPIKIKTRHTIYNEEYGKTKISGAISDIINYGKPAILPKDYQVRKELQPITMQYDSVSELENILYNIASNREFRPDMETIKNCLQYYKPKQTLNEFDKFFGDIIIQR